MRRTTTIAAGLLFCAALKDGHPVADVMLVKGTEWKTVAEKLD
jgi:hypothetical protein